MGNYKVISAVGETLRQILLTGMKPDSAVFGDGGIIRSDDRVTLDHPHTLIADGEPQNNYLSVFLYRILENADAATGPLQPMPGTKHQLALSLYFLITPITNSADDNFRLLGKAMQILFDCATVKGSAMHGTLRGAAEELHVVFNPLAIDDAVKLWNSFMRPFQLSVAYEVKVLHIDSEREVNTDHAPRRRSELTQI